MIRGNQQIREILKPVASLNLTRARSTWQKSKKLLNRNQIIEIIAIAFLCFLALIGCAQAEQITEEKAVHCILGEAQGEGYASLLAHAEAIRNRGHLKGVYGCRADISKDMPYLKAKGILAQAKQAWKESAHTNTVKGADHWGSLLIDGDWLAQMKKKGFVQTAVIKNTAFFKESK